MSHVGRLQGGLTSLCCCRRRCCCAPVPLTCGWSAPPGRSRAPCSAPPRRATACGSARRPAGARHPSRWSWPVGEGGVQAMEGGGGGAGGRHAFEGGWWGARSRQMAATTAAPAALAHPRLSAARQSIGDGPPGPSRGLIKGSTRLGGPKPWRRRRHQPLGPAQHQQGNTQVSSSITQAPSSHNAVIVM